MIKFVTGGALGFFLNGVVFNDKLTIDGGWLSYQGEIILLFMLASLSVWSGYQRFMIMMIFNPDSASCEIARDYPRRKQMPIGERAAFEAVIWAYIVFWPIVELAAMTANAVTRLRTR